MPKAIAFDTLEYMEELAASGMEIKEAEAITKATAKAFEQMVRAKELATKSDILAVRSDIKELEIKLIKWMFGIVAGQTALVFGILKYFHP